LEDAAHALHPIEQSFGEVTIAEEMIVEEVEVTARQALDLGERVVYPLGVEATTALEEGVLVTEIAVLRTSSCDDDGVWHKIVAATDEIATNWRYSLEGATTRGGVHGSWIPGAEIGQEARKGLLAGA
jgi:hypothetical protein